jgi:tetratricopeptide (TPR) repeat protein
LFAATALFGAAQEDFYDESFRHGVAAFESGHYDAALERLRIAAFGYIEDVARYEVANAYIAIAAKRLERPAESTAALRRIAVAERVERRFASLPMPDALRAAVADAAKALLTPQQAALLTADLPHATLLKTAEDLYRANDFRGAVAAFERAGAFAKGEEPYRYEYAVALYESGRHRDAKRELAAALPFIEKTPEIERYRAKIEQSLD